MLCPLTAELLGNYWSILHACGEWDFQPTLPAAAWRSPAPKGWLRTLQMVHQPERSSSPPCRPARNPAVTTLPRGGKGTQRRLSRVHSRSPPPTADRSSEAGGSKCLFLQLTNISCFLSLAKGDKKLIFSS